MYLWDQHKFSVIFSYLMFIFIPMLLATPAFAGVYQWVDENGQVHFGDRAPIGAKSKNISSKLDKINISTDLSSPELLLKYAEEKERKQQSQQDAYNKKIKELPSISQACSNAKQYLKKIAGRVIFLDDDGKAVKVSEQERKAKVLEIEKIIRQKCH